MKFFKSLVLAASAAVGTAFVLNKATDGYVKEAVTDKLFGVDDIGNPEIEEDLGPINGFDLLTDEEGKKHVIMPAEDAVNLYQTIEDAITMIDPEKSDYDLFGDKALSFEKLYDCIESLLDAVSNDVDEICNDQEEGTDNLKDTSISKDDHNDIQKEMYESM